MPGSTPARRSARGHVPNKRYSVDAFAGLDDLGSADDTEEESEDGDESRDSDSLRPVVTGADALTQSDDDFDGTDAGQEIEGANDGDEDDDDERDLGDDASAAGASDESGAATPGEDGADEEAAVAVRKGVSRRRRGPPKMELNSTYRLRGLAGKPSKANHERVLLEYYGQRAYVSMARSIDKFISNVTFPVRFPGRQDSGLAYPPGFEHGVPLNEPAAVPYFHPDANTSICMQQLQDSAVVPPDQQDKYAPPGSVSLSVQIGCYTEDNPLSLPFTRAVHLEDVFTAAAGQNDDDSEAESRASRRRGWIINAGARILSMSWAPSGENEYQYLAVAIEQAPPSTAFPQTPFVAGPRFASSVQIWRCRTAEAKADEEASTPAEETAELVHIVCTDWGGCRRLKWCPLTPAGVFSHNGRSWEHIGRLACVWTDGNVRVVEVSIPVGGSQTHWLYNQPILEAKPPDSVCSCVDWISNKGLAVGCANGYLAIFDLDDIQPQGQQGIGTRSPVPYFYHELSDTYIVDISSGAPVSPNLVAICSVSGHQLLVDIRAPQTDTVTSMRSRVYVTSIRHSPHLQGFFSTDDQGDIALLVSRRFYSGKRVLQTTAGSADGAIVATSPVHTSILVGTLDGTISCTNPVRKQIDTKQANAWSQKWFVHEWRPQGEGGGQGREARNEAEREPSTPSIDPALLREQREPQAMQRSGKIRVTEGYRPERVGGVERKSISVVQPTIIYDEEQGVTALEWNPNIQHGGWAAVGFGSGLLRIEDVSLTAPS